MKSACLFSCCTGLEAGIFLHLSKSPCSFLNPDWLPTFYHFYFQCDKVSPRVPSVIFFPVSLFLGRLLFITFLVMSVSPLAAQLPSGMTAASPLQLHLLAFQILLLALPLFISLLCLHLCSSILSIICFCKVPRRFIAGRHGGNTIPHVAVCAVTNHLETLKSLCISCNSCSDLGTERLIEKFLCSANS